MNLRRILGDRGPIARAGDLGHPDRRMLVSNLPVFDEGDKPFPEHGMEAVS